LLSFCFFLSSNLKKTKYLIAHFKLLLRLSKMVESHSTSDDSSENSMKEVQPVVDKETGPERASLDSEKGIAASAVPPDPNDWNGPDDPQNPLNWPLRRKLWHVISPALMAFVA